MLNLKKIKLLWKHNQKQLLYLGWKNRLQSLFITMIGFAKKSISIDNGYSFCGFFMDSANKMNISFF